MIDRSILFARVVQGQSLDQAEATFLCQSLDPFLWLKLLGQNRAEGSSLIATHVLKAEGRCPVDGTVDAYTITVRLSGLLPVERIRQAVDELLAEPVYQEQFTRALHHALDDVEVATVCMHQGARVETTVVVR